MAWIIKNLTTAANSVDVAFKGRGCLFADGTFGDGVVELRPISIGDDGVKVVSTGFIDTAIDGTDLKSLDVPAGHYRVTLSGSTGADLNIWCNDQVEVQIPK